MRKFLILLCFFVLILTGFGLARSGKIFAPHPARASVADHPPQPTGLIATYRSGQTFLTWTERAGLAGETYRLYRHNQSITAVNFSQATLLYEVPEGSARFFANRYNVDYSGTWQARYVDRFVIQDNGAQLSAGTGLLVWTLAADDFDGDSSGNGYYAVTTVEGGVENTADFSTGNTAGPVVEAVADPLPVEVNANVGSRGHVFIQYVPLRAWNPTFHAPNETNLYYGLDDADPQVANAIQYAYDYVVYEPGTTQCGSTIPDELPVILILHGWDGNTYAPPSQDPDPWEGWCAYKIYPVDVTETWWFGFAQNHDYRQGGNPTAGDVIVNYTEQRILRMVYDLIQDPTGPNVDTNRIYVYGHSMGASGALAMALRYPNLFAAAYASEPMTNYRTSGDGGGTDWRGDVTPKWGSPGDNLPVWIGGPGNWATHLQSFNGTGVWNWQNHQENLQSRQGDEMAPFGIGHGLNDTVIEWSTQGQPAYAAFNASRRAWGGAVTDADHTWLSFQGLPPALADNGAGPFGGFQAVRDESVPGLSNASNDLTLPPNTTGGYNHTLLWSSSWNAWDGAPTDTPGQWQISLCSIDPNPWVNDCGSGMAQTVDVTPRRTQSFAVVPGASYTWENRRVSDNGLVVSGTVVADASGVVTVTDFAVSPEGNRLILEPVGGPPPTATPTPTSTTSPVVFLNFLPTILKKFGATPAPTSTPTPTASATPSVSPTPTSTPDGGGTAPRPWPDTTTGIHIFNDQLAPWMSAAQWQFAATRYAGTQKMLRSDADQLRAINPNFLILHYRLGHGLGYRAIQNDCDPTGDWLEVIEGDDWVQEWPGDNSVEENWFYHWPEGSANRVLSCDWGWYLAKLDDAAWRTYWHDEVLRQVQANDNDGVFMDSLSVPNYLGYDRYNPPLPPVDNAFEAAWATRIENWLSWLQSQALGNNYLIPNVGSWITSRETTDYSAADGVMIEGFALEADESPYNLEDWRMQMNRALGLIGQGRAILAQSYATGDQERMFTLGSYLLIKGNRTYINIDLDLEPEWWPEYDIPIGEPIESAGVDVGNLYDAVNQVYRRDYDNGFVLINPTSPWDSTGITTTVDLGGTFYLPQPSGGGSVPGDGIPTGTIIYQSVTQGTLPPYTTMVLLNESP